MGVTGAAGFAFAAYYQFRGVRKDTVKEGWVTGITWYVELILLDLLFLVALFGMTLADYSHLLLSYLTSLILSVAIGYIKR
jgi:ABC-type Na+ efflux pump permease subunit